MCAGASPHSRSGVIGCLRTDALLPVAWTAKAKSFFGGCNYTPGTCHTYGTRKSSSQPKEGLAFNAIHWPKMTSNDFQHLPNLGVVEDHQFLRLNHVAEPVTNITCIKIVNGKNSLIRPPPRPQATPSSNIPMYAQCLNLRSSFGPAMTITFVAAENTGVFGAWEKGMLQLFRKAQMEMNQPIFASCVFWIARLLFFSELDLQTASAEIRVGVSSFSLKSGDSMKIWWDFENSQLH